MHKNRSGEPLEEAPLLLDLTEKTGVELILLDVEAVVFLNWIVPKSVEH